MCLKQLLFHSFLPLHLLNHITLFLLKGLYSYTCTIPSWLWIMFREAMNPSARAAHYWVVSESAPATLPRQRVCFLSWRACCDISPGDNMLIYSTAVEANCNTPPQPSTHASLMAYINPHVISRSPQAPTFKGGYVHCRPALDRITSDAIYYHTDFYLLSHSSFSLSFSPSLKPA